MLFLFNNSATLMMGIRMLCVLVFTSLLLGLGIDAHECDPDEMKCDDGACIDKQSWCDAVIDCRDTSDEKYCNGRIPCKSIHFACSSGKCIPQSAVCDNVDDCGDASDEQNCLDSSFLEETVQSSFNYSKEAAAKAMKYIMDKRDSDYSWDSFTPRAVIALSLASKHFPLAEKDHQLMKKQLNVRLTMDLMERKSISLSSLSIYINALHATCQDPRNFQGIDLVARLRSEVDLATQKNTSMPLAYLTLCISDSATSNLIRYEDKARLAQMYNMPEFRRIGSRALIVMAMSCIYSTDTSVAFSNHFNHFVRENSIEVQIADIYAQALFMQASLTIGIPVNVGDLIRKQQPDGSFGDLLATYYAVPVLLNSSLLDLKCPRNKGAKLDRMMANVNGEKEVAYSLWMTSGKELTSHSMTIKFDGHESFFDIMRMAAARNPLYKFLYEETNDGKMVYSLSGIPNDVESGRSWVLYSGNVDTVKINSVQHLKKEELGVDKIFPEDQEHFVFWLKNSERN